MLCRFENLLAQFVVALSQLKNLIAQFAVVFFNFKFLVEKFVIVLFSFKKSFAEFTLRLANCFFKCPALAHTYARIRLGGSLVYVLVASASRYFFNSDYGIVASFLNQ